MGNQASHADRQRREELVKRVVMDTRDARRRGLVLTDAEVIGKHSVLLPEIKTALHKLSIIEGAKPSHKTSSSIENQEPIHLRPGFEPMVQIPDYRLIRPIGIGAFGIVWLARNHHDGQHSAIKTLHWGEETEIQGIRQFKPLAAVNPFVVPIGHVGEVDSTYYYVMPLADDGAAGQSDATWESYTPLTLESHVERHGVLNLRESVNIAVDILEALHLLHEGGVVHRDVKPANVLRFDGQWKLGDPGLLADPNSVVSRAGTSGFTPRQATTDRGDDLYAVGKTLEVITGLEDGSELQELTKLGRIVNRACHDNPKQRFHSAREFQRALRSLTSGPSKRRLLLVALCVALFVSPFLMQYIPPKTPVELSQVSRQIIECKPTVYDGRTRNRKGILGTTIDMTTAGDGVHFEVKLDKPGFVQMFSVRESVLVREFPHEAIERVPKDTIAIHPGRAVSVSQISGFDIFVVIALASDDVRFVEDGSKQFAAVRSSIDQAAVNCTWTYDGVFEPYQLARRSDAEERRPLFEIDSAPPRMKAVVDYFESRPEVLDIWAVGFPVKKDDEKTATQSVEAL